MASREDRMRAALAAHFHGADIEISNDSALHAGHRGDDGTGETHYSVKIIHSSFVGLSRIDRHRLINTILQKEFELGLHALTINANTP